MIVDRAYYPFDKEFIHFCGQQKYNVYMILQNSIYILHGQGDVHVHVLYVCVMCRYHIRTRNTKMKFLYTFILPKSIIDYRFKVSVYIFHYVLLL